jgi:hypothetical protein
VDWLLRHIRVGRAVHSEGVALILESGHENNPQAEIELNWVREHFEIQNVLKSISFVPNNHCRAVQWLVFWPFTLAGTVLTS